LVTEYRRRAEEIERLAIHLMKTAARNGKTAVSTFISRSALGGSKATKSMVDHEGLPMRVVVHSAQNPGSRRGRLGPRQDPSRLPLT